MEKRIVVESIAQVHDLLTLSKPQHPLVTVVHHEDMHAHPEDFRGVSIVSELYQIIFKDGMEGSLGYGRNSYDFIEGSIIFIKPGQVITFQEHSHVSKKESRAWSLMFHPDLIRKSNLGLGIDDYSFFSYDVTEALHVSDEEKESLSGLIEKIKSEYNHKIDVHSQKLIVANINLLLDYCQRYYDRQFYTRSNLNKDLITEFEHLLKDYYQEERQLDLGLPTVKYCGTELKMTPNYLSDLLKKETGKSTQEHIHAYVMNRAKTKLLASKQSIGQIAYDLGFEYTQHFSKIFKKKTGMSPMEYRSLN